MFFVPARFIFLGRLSFFIICYWKSWKEQNQQALLSIQIILQSCITGVTQFLKTKHLLNESYFDVLKAPYLLRYIV